MIETGKTTAFQYYESILETAVALQYATLEVIADKFAVYR